MSFIVRLLNVCVVSLNLLKCVCCVFEFVISIDIYSINWKVCKEDENSEQLTFNLGIKWLLFLWCDYPAD